MSIFSLPGVAAVTKNQPVKEVVKYVPVYIPVYPQFDNNSYQASYQTQQEVQQNYQQYNPYQYANNYYYKQPFQPAYSNNHYSEQDNSIENAIRLVNSVSSLVGQVQRRY